ncbi:hypothetical protein TK90_2662 (plasmid) [Thioalkalivibrio sp. K90mix]|uniref:hypothetical protein n=1 Tax=Thioalkalivibrio sp. (strain K90mix) TaxID=396595 RepID=UPI000195A3B2|nr:hypothetical protein [Thioalkalivibrio sp. K90mix]ADC73149.1 hypothetical protein TK90_2662 [Thioalkalivibrio sp. K90mix]
METRYDAHPTITWDDWLTAAAPAQGPNQGVVHVVQGMAMSTDGLTLHMEATTAACGWYRESTHTPLDPSNEEWSFDRAMMWIFERRDALERTPAPDRFFRELTPWPANTRVAIAAGRYVRGWALPPSAQPQWDVRLAVPASLLHRALTGLLGPGETMNGLRAGFHEYPRDRSEVTGIRIEHPASGREVLMPVSPVAD